MQPKLLEILKNEKLVENKDFWTDLGNTLLGQVIDTGNNLLQTLSLQAAIALAQFGLGNGIPAIGKRELPQQLKDFWSELGDSLLDSLIGVANPLLGSLSLLGAQLLAQFGLGGGLPTIGKRELDQFKDFWSELGDSLLDSLIGVANPLLGSLSLLGAQLLAQFGLGGGLPTIGRRELEPLKDFWSELGDSLLDSLIGVANPLLGSLSLLGAQLLAQFGLGGGIPTIGKREMEQLKGFWDDLGSSLLGLVVDVANPLLASTSLLAAQLLAQFGLGGGLPTIGKREAMPLNEFLSTLGSNSMELLSPFLQTTLSSLSLSAAQWLAAFGLGNGLPQIG